MSSNRCLTWPTLLFLLSASAVTADPTLRIPASTAYVSPDPEAARVSSRSGVTQWKDPGQKIEWFGGFHQTGTLEAQVTCTYASNLVCRLQLSLGDQSRQATITGAGTNQVLVPFGTFQLNSTGYQRFSLQALVEASPSLPQVEALTLTGKPMQDAHFNLKPRRNAASVHLSYPTPTNVHVAAFYCEMTGVLDPVNTYYMACGWHRGYFGMQVNSPTERRIIFSVWDSGKEAIDRNKVDDENRVKLLGKGEGVHAGDFGNEGTGGHSHLKYGWETGETQRFLVTAQPTNGTFTVYSGYYFHPNRRQWMLISSWRAPKDGKWLRGLYSFSENFGGSTGHIARRARYGNQWIRTDTGEWQEITKASFSHDPTGKSDRLDRFMGLEGGQFFLSHGGFLPGFTKFGEKFVRPATGKPPLSEFPFPLSP